MATVKSKAEISIVAMKRKVCFLLLLADAEERLMGLELGPRLMPKGRGPAPGITRAMFE